jgi:MOSC domain-containing protein YiiM
MDLIYPGLQKMMKNNKQGIIAEVIVGGEIRVNDIIKKID